MTIEDFHAHLDICSRCRNQCFNLCAIGTKLLKEAAEKPFALPLSSLVEPEGFGERDFFTEVDNELASDEQKEE